MKMKTFAKAVARTYEETLIAYKGIESIFPVFICDAASRASGKFTARYCRPLTRNNSYTTEEQYSKLSRAYKREISRRIDRQTTVGSYLCFCNLPVDMTSQIAFRRALLQDMIDWAEQVDSRKIALPRI